MPAFSREILTPRLIVECQLEQGKDGLEAKQQVIQTTTTCQTSDLLSLPTELRLKILRYLLLFEHNADIHTRRLPRDSIDHLLNLDSRRILEAPQFKHKSRQEINGVLPIFFTCNVHTSILQVCRTLYNDGCSVLYHQNTVVAVQSGISGLGSRLRNYGLRVWGPIAAQRVVGSGSALTSRSPVPITAFSPLITFRGHNSKPESPVYICGRQEVTCLLHALWILIKCPFARGMKFTVHVAPTSQYRVQQSTDGIIRHALLPCMHNHIESITGSEDAKDMLPLWTTKLGTHAKASVSDPNVYTYNTVCSYLEHFMESGEKAIEEKKYLRAEAMHEMLCYEACSIVRTRTGKLVDVSTKTKEGINRVCKLIAISAFRLAELRSGVIETFPNLRDCVCKRPNRTEKKETRPDSARDRQVSNLGEIKNDLRNRTENHMKEEAKNEITDGSKNGSTSEKDEDSCGASPSPPCPLHGRESSYRIETKSEVKTTRLAPSEAVDHAILSALLALRLPCACPVPEWNLRLNIILLYLFNLKSDAENTKACLRRIYMTCSALRKEASAKNRNGGKWADLERLVEDLRPYLSKEIKKAKKRKEVYGKLVVESELVVRKIWGERLMPRKGYQGLIWTFRWA